MRMFNFWFYRMLSLESWTMQDGGDTGNRRRDLDLLKLVLADPCNVLKSAVQS